MYDYKDPTRVTRAAVTALYLFAVLDLAASALAIAMPPVPNALNAADYASIPQVLTQIACIILVGRWLYRTNANAHALGREVSITPGWAVGWFFVPVASFYKPYQGVTETWDASHEGAGLDEGGRSPLLPWWWGLWIVDNITGWIAFRLGGGLDAQPGPTALLVAMISSLVNVPVCLLLIRIARRLSEVQVTAASRRAFA